MDDPIDQRERHEGRNNSEPQSKVQDSEEGLHKAGNKQEEVSASPKEEPELEEIDH